MLPDWPRIKNDLEEYLYRRLKKQSSPGGSGFRMRTILEGNVTRFVRHDGTQDISGDKPNIEAEFKIMYGEMGKIEFEEIARRIDGAAATLKAKSEKRQLEAVSEAATRANNVVDGKNRPLSDDTLLDVLEKQSILFDHSGQPILIPNVTEDPNGNLSPIPDERWQRLRANPVTKERYEKLIERKYNEWRTREASRRLVG